MMHKMNWRSWKIPYTQIMESKKIRKEPTMLVGVDVCHDTKNKKSFMLKRGPKQSTVGWCASIDPDFNYYKYVYICVCIARIYVDTAFTKSRFQTAMYACMHAHLRTDNYAHTITHTQSYTHMHACIHSLACRSWIAFQSANTEIITTALDLMCASLEAFKTQNRIFPRNVIIYRDGVGDSQIASFVKQEIKEYQKAFTKLGIAEGSINVREYACAYIEGMLHGNGRCRVDADTRRAATATSAHVHAWYTYIHGYTFN